MILRLLPSRFGRKKDIFQHGSWQIFRLVHYSSVRTDNYRFTIQKVDDGMTVSGYCYDSVGKEHRFDHIRLTGATAYSLFLASEQKLQREARSPLSVR